MNSRHEKCKQPVEKKVPITVTSNFVRPTKPKALLTAIASSENKEPVKVATNVRPTMSKYAFRSTASSAKKVPVKTVSNVVLPTEPQAVLGTTTSSQSLKEENTNLKNELEMALAANKRMEDEINVLEKRAEELTFANNKLVEALAAEQISNKRFNDLNENMKPLIKELTTFVESQKLEVHASFVEMLKNVKQSFLTSAETVSIEVEKIKALQDWTKVRNIPEYDLWTLKLTAIEKQKEMAKYLEENVAEETLRESLIKSLKLMFTKDFFVKKITFGHEADRVYFRGSNLLKSLQMSLASKFPAEDTSSKGIQKKIRNFKDALAKNPDLWIEEPINDVLNQTNDIEV